MHNLKAIMMGLLLMSTTAGCSGLTAASVAAVRSVPSAYLRVFDYPGMSAKSRWCHLRHTLAGRPPQYGDGTCESLQ